MLFSRVRSDGSAEFHYPDPHAHDVRVTGSFCGWQTPGYTLERHAGGFRGAISDLPHGVTAYKFVVDGRFTPDPVNLSRGSDDNSLLFRGVPRGALAHLRFHSPALGDTRGYVVYLPPGYAAHAERRFPVLVLLHGALDWERTWADKGALTDTLDGLYASGSIGDLLVVMPAENGALFHGDTRVADYLARDVVGHIDAEFRTLSAARHRALDGLSTGGFTSLVVGAWRTGVFGAIGSMSGCHDARSFEAIAASARAIQDAQQRFLVSCGRDEPHLDTCRSVAGALRDAGADATWHDAPGSHDWSLWREALGRHVAFHWRHIGAGLA